MSWPVRLSIKLALETMEARVAGIADGVPELIWLRRASAAIHRRHQSAGPTTCWMETGSPYSPPVGVESTPITDRDSGSVMQ